MSQTTEADVPKTNVPGQSDADAQNQPKNPKGDEVKTRRDPDLPQEKHDVGSTNDSGTKESLIFDANEIEEKIRKDAQEVGKDKTQVYEDGGLTGQKVDLGSDKYRQETPSKDPS